MESEKPNLAAEYLNRNGKALSVVLAILPVLVLAGLYMSQQLYGWNWVPAIALCLGTWDFLFLIQRLKQQIGEFGPTERALLINGSVLLVLAVIGFIWVTIAPALKNY